MNPGTDCPNCGCAPHDPVAPCSVCGHFRLGRLRIFRGDLEVDVVSVRTRVGRAVLGRWLGAEEGVYAAEVQYSFVPDTHVGWSIVAQEGCRNPTRLNGEVLVPGKSCRLIDGMNVTIGISHACVRIGIDRAT